MKNVVIVGGSYVGLMAAQELIKRLPGTKEYRVVVVEKNSHFSHLFAYPRFSVVSAYEHKAFIPFSTMLPLPHEILTSTTAVSVSPSSRTITVVDAQTAREFDIEYEAVVLATGTTLSPPGTIPGRGTKREGIQYLQSLQRDLANADKVVILGGGAIGVQMACDLATLYPPSCGGGGGGGGKSITLVHSHETLMNRFHPLLSDIIKQRFRKLGVETVLGSRAKLAEGGFEKKRGEVLRIETLDGRVVEADCIIRSTGQTPNAQLVSTFAPTAIAPNGFVSVDGTLRVVPRSSALGPSELEGRIFAIGDVADTGAQKAARPALAHAQVLARNIVKLLADEPPASYESIVVASSAIHLTLGFAESIVFRNPGRTATGQWDGEPQVVWKKDGRTDLEIESVWERRLGNKPEHESEYHL